MPVSLALAAALHFAVYFWGSSYEQSKKRLDSANAPYRRPAAAEIVDSSSFLAAKVTILNRDAGLFGYRIGPVRRRAG